MKFIRLNNNYYINPELISHIVTDVNGMRVYVAGQLAVHLDSVASPIAIQIMNNLIQRNLVNSDANN